MQSMEKYSGVYIDGIDEKADMLGSGKLLILTYSHEFNGGAVCFVRNYRALCSIFGKENIKTFDLAKFDNSRKSNVFEKISNFIYGRIFIRAKIEDMFIKKCKDFSFVFIDRSIYGLVAKKIKRNYPKIRIITFFHNVELDFHKDFGGVKNHQLWRIFRNEKMICKYSDITIALNYRDAQRIEQVYNKKIDFVIPISFANREINFNKESTSKNLVALFFGSNFPMNTHGIKWFVMNVLPFVNIKLQIIMKDIVKENLPKSDKLEPLGFVENLESYIRNADLIILPIFKGSGMKVKTCEALMHGKNIIGTGEAFVGYDVDFEKVGAKCETAEEFIKAINEFQKRFTNKFNEYSRSVFLEKYSDDVTFKQFSNIFDDLEKKYGK